MTTAAGRGPAGAGPLAVGATIDVGSNSVLLLTAAVGADRRAHVVDEAVETTRLGTGLTPGGRLDAAARRRTEETVVRFAARARAAGAGRTSRIWAFATGAVRDAADGPAFARELAASSGVPVEVLSGEEEARLAYAAVAHAFDAGGPMLAIDVGGRTTELTLGTGDVPRTMTSFALGVLALTEGVAQADPPAAGDVERLAAAIDDVLAASPLLAEAGRNGSRAIVSGGSATAVASLDLGLSTYSPRRVHGHRLSSAALRRVAAALAAMTADARGRLPALEPGRGAVVLAGALVLERLANAVGGELTASAHGVRHGHLRARFLADGVPADFRELWA